MTLPRRAQPVRAVLRVSLPDRDVQGHGPGTRLRLLPGARRIRPRHRRRATSTSAATSNSHTFAWRNSSRARSRSTRTPAKFARSSPGPGQQQSRNPRRSPRSSSGSTSGTARTGPTPTGSSPTPSKRTSSTTNASNSKQQATTSKPSRSVSTPPTSGPSRSRLDRNEKVAAQLLDDEDLRAALVAEYLPRIYAGARVARQRTCPICRRIVEEQGVPREMFGRHKKATAQIVRATRTICLTQGDAP